MSGASCREVTRSSHARTYQRGADAIIPMLWFHTEDVDPYESAHVHYFVRLSFGSDVAFQRHYLAQRLSYLQTENYLSLRFLRKKEHGNSNG